MYEVALLAEALQANFIGTKTINEFSKFYHEANDVLKGFGNTVNATRGMKKTGRVISRLIAR